MSGWFAVKRGITSHPVFKGDMAKIGFFLWLMESAAYTDTVIDLGGQPYTVPRGSLCYSQRFMAQKAGMSVKALRTFLAALEKHGIIGIEVAETGQAREAKRTQVTLCNYDKYQTPGNNGETTGKQRGNNGETKKNKETREQGNNNPPTPQGEDDPDFARFWEHVPRKKQKKQASIAWKKAVKSTDPETIIKGMVAFAASVKGKDPQYIAHPTTWLNGARWEDDLSGDQRRPDLRVVGERYIPSWERDEGPRDIYGRVIEC